MKTETQIAPPGKSWFSEHPFITVSAILAVCLGPFINQAIQTDDTLFVWTAQWLPKHPADFFGFNVNWWDSSIPMWVANYNPPLLSYLLAGVGTFFGWHEIALHLACLAVACAAAAGIYALAEMWCERPLLAAVVAIFTPAFLVLSTTLMCDVMMLAFWIWALVFWERALSHEHSRWQFILAGVLAGLAVLTKYSAVTLLPLLAVLSLLRTRKPGWWCAGLLVPLILVAVYEWMTARMYGHGLLSLAGNYARTHRFEFPGGGKARAIIGLAFAGGSLLPLLFFAPWLWRRKSLLAGGAFIFAVLIGVFWFGGDPGLMHAWVDPDGGLMRHWDFRLQTMLLTAAGLHLLLLAVAEAWQRRDRISLTILIWIWSVCIFAGVLNWTVNARSFLPSVPAAAILLVRRLSLMREDRGKNRWLFWPLAPAAFIGLSLVVANYELANSARAAAQRIVATYKTAGHTLWFEGHGGFQYYLEQAGGQPVDVERSLLLPGDMVAVALLGDFVQLPAGSVAPAKSIFMRLHSWMNLQASSAHGAAGFYTSDCGPIPFAFGEPQARNYFLVKVFPRLQYQSRPANPQEVLAGAVPSFPHTAYSLDDGPARAEAKDAAEQIRLASQFEADGKIDEAVSRYQAALNADAGHPVALDHLARILATASEVGLRDSKTAVQLAAQAVKLTEWRQAAVIGTLATAYAADGQFAKAVVTARFARDLAILTGQPDVAAGNAKLIRQCAAGKATETSEGP